MVDVIDKTDGKRKRTRSPAYPYMNLETAIKRVRDFYNKEGRNSTNIKVAVKHWGYEEKSSAGMQAVAALISFGLLKDEGTAEKRKVQLTPNALRILLDTDPSSTARTEAIKAAALSPKIHNELWKKWGSTHPSDLSMKNVLTLEREPPFNDKAVDFFIKEYKDTIAFARLGDSDTLSADADDKAVEGKDISELASDGLAIGDYVQWEPGGILQFQKAKRISRFDGKYAFVDGSNTGVPVGELSKQARPEPLAPPTRHAISRTLSVNLREDIFSLAEGNATFQWPTPLSPDSIADLKDWLTILERKISRSVPEIAGKDQSHDRIAENLL